jgi:DnaJ-class molecular chaperone
LDLIYKKTITLKEALLGFTFDLQHINGQFFNFNNVNQIIRPGFKKKLPNLGMIRENNTGSLWIEFDVLFPESLTENQFAVLKETL